MNLTVTRFDFFFPSYKFRSLALAFERKIKSIRFRHSLPNNVVEDRVDANVRDRLRLIIYEHLLVKSKKEHCSARSAVNDPRKASGTGSSSRSHHRPREKAPASQYISYIRRIQVRRYAGKIRSVTA